MKGSGSFLFYRQCKTCKQWKNPKGGKVSGKVFTCSECKERK